MKMAATTRVLQGENGTSPGPIIAEQGHAGARITGGTASRVGSSGIEISEGKSSWMRLGPTPGNPLAVKA